MVQWGGYGFDFNEPLHLGAGMVFSYGEPNRTDYPLKKKKFGQMGFPFLFLKINWAIFFWTFQNSGPININ
jgi:hypothetical protein